MSRVQPLSQHDSLFSENDVSLHHVKVKLARREGTMFLQDFSRSNPLIFDSLTAICRKDWRDNLMQSCRNIAPSTRGNKQLGASLLEVFPPVATLYSRDRRSLFRHSQNTRTLATVKCIATFRFRVESKNSQLTRGSRKIPVLMFVDWST